MTEIRPKAWPKKFTPMAFRMTYFLELSIWLPRKYGVLCSQACKTKLNYTLSDGLDAPQRIRGRCHETTVIGYQQDCLFRSWQLGMLGQSQARIRPQSCIKSHLYAKFVRCETLLSICANVILNVQHDGGKKGSLIPEDVE